MYTLIHYSNNDKETIWEFPKSDEGFYDMQQKIDRLTLAGSRIYLLAIEPIDKIYIDDNWIHLAHSIMPLYKSQERFFFQEYTSFEDAYRSALEMRETHPLCYDRTSELN